MKRQFFFTIGVVLALAVTLCGARPVFAQTVVTTIPVGDAPSDIAVNPNTNLIYVANGNSNTVSVINGSLDTVVATIALPSTISRPILIALNPSTNRIYAVRGSLLFVIDGSTNTVIAVTGLGGFLPAIIEDITVNANTNRIYALDRVFGVQVIDGSTNAVIARISVGSSIEGKSITVNPSTNRIYVSDLDHVSVIDGASNTTVATVPSGFFLSSAAVNPDTNRVYVSGLDSVGFFGSVSVIDGGINAVITSLSLPTMPSDIAVNPSTNRIYIPDQVGGVVSVIDGNTNSLMDIVTVGGAPSSVAVNPNTNRIYVANTSDDTVSVIDDPGNLSPAAEAGGPYSVNEGASVTVTASGSDPEGAPLTYSWDLDNDGSFETPGQSVNFSALDGPSNHTIAVQVTDEGGLTATASTTVDVLNVAPAADFTSTPSTLFVGQSATLSFSNPIDPSGADTTAGFQYSYDCTDDGSFELSGTVATSYVCACPASGSFNSRGRIQDKDGDFTDYTVQIIALTPQEGTEGLIDQVQSLIAQGVLSEGHGNALIAKLDGAIKQLEKGKTKTAVNELQAFISQVNDFMNSTPPVLTPAQGQPLLDAANAIIAALGA